MAAPASSQFFRLRPLFLFILLLFIYAPHLRALKRAQNKECEAAFHTCSVRAFWRGVVIQRTNRGVKIPQLSCNGRPGSVSSKPAARYQPAAPYLFMESTRFLAGRRIFIHFRLTGFFR